MRRPTRYVVPAAALLLALTACADSGSDRKPAAQTSTPSATASPTADATTEESASSEPSPSASDTGSEVPAGGTADQPTVLEADTDLLDWEQVPGSVDDTVTRGGGWTLTVDATGNQAELAGPDSAKGWSSSGDRVSDALLDEDYAVVVLQDKEESDPSSAIVTDLSSGREFTLDGGSDIPTTNGGTWALGAGHLLHATIHKRSYCVASVDLATRKSTLGWCAPARQGFNGASITPAGDAMTTFDDSQPSCRTVVRLTGAETEPFPGATDCHGFEGVVTEGGAVWSVVPQERQIENARLYARVGDGYFDLGPGSSGTLTWCGGAAYFSRDPQRARDNASLMRWSPDDGLSTVYESPGGQAFLPAPRCGGDTITLTALAQAGDEQVSASVR